RSAARRGTPWNSPRAGPTAAIAPGASPLGLGAVDQVVDQLLQGDFAARRLLRWRVLAHHRQALPLPECLPFALIDQLDVDRDLHLPPGDVRAPLTGRERERDVRIVAHHAPAHDRIG